MESPIKQVGTSPGRIAGTCLLVFVAVAATAASDVIDVGAALGSKLAAEREQALVELIEARVSIRERP